jgi:ABC-type sugar transport system permease subunit
MDGFNLGPDWFWKVLRLLVVIGALTVLLSLIMGIIWAVKIIL